MKLKQFLLARSAKLIAHRQHKSRSVALSVGRRILELRLHSEERNILTTHNNITSLVQTPWKMFFLLFFSFILITLYIAQENVSVLAFSFHFQSAISFNKSRQLFYIFAPSFVSPALYIKFNVLINTFFAGSGRRK